MIDLLPNRDAAIVEDKKIKAYLLNLDHPKGRSKAKFFIAQGFTIDNIELFRSMLLRHGRLNTVTKTETNAYGTKYIIEGVATYPDNIVATAGIRKKVLRFNLRTVWSIAVDANVPKLVSAYPID